MGYSNKKAAVALDTSILFAIGQFKIDIFDEIERLVGKSEFAVPSAVEDELKRLLKKKKKEVSLAKALMKLKKVKIIKLNEKKADMALLKLAKAGYIVATADKGLKKKIKAFGGRIIYPRQKKYLEIV